MCGGSKLRLKFLIGDEGGGSRGDAALLIEQRGSAVPAYGGSHAGF